MKKLVCALSIIALIVPALAFAEPGNSVEYSDQLEYGLSPEFMGHGVYYVNLTAVEDKWLGRAMEMRPAKDGERERKHIEADFEKLVATALGDWQVTILASVEREIVSVVSMCGFGREAPGVTTGLIIVTRPKPDAGKWGFNEGN